MYLDKIITKFGIPRNHSVCLVFRSPKYIKVVSEILCHISEQTHSIAVTASSSLMLHGELIGMCCEKSYEIRE